MVHDDSRTFLWLYFSKDEKREYTLEILPPLFPRMTWLELTTTLDIVVKGLSTYDNCSNRLKVLFLCGSLRRRSVLFSPGGAESQQDPLPSGMHSRIFNPEGLPVKTDSEHVILGARAPLPELSK